MVCLVFLFSSTKHETKRLCDDISLSHFSHSFYQIDMCYSVRQYLPKWSKNNRSCITVGCGNRRVTKKISWSSDVGQLRYVAFKIVNLAIFWVLYLSCPTSKLHEKIFGNSPLTEVNMVFYGPCLGTSPVLRKWARKNPWKSKNAKKMPLSLASSSDVARILAMTHKDTIDL